MGFPYINKQCPHHPLLVYVALSVCMHACTHCRPESQNSSTSLIPLSRFTAMLMWDLYQNGWCKAQTGPMSQLASLRNGSTRTSTHAQTRGSTIPFSSLRLTIFLSQTLLHIHYLLNAVSHTHAQTYSAPPWDTASGLYGKRRGKKKCWNGGNKESENETENEEARDWSSIPNSSQLTSYSFKPQS